MEQSKIARVCHEVNRAYCLSIGDSSQAPWDQAPDWQKQSAINGVKFHIDNPEASPSALHDKWLEEKFAAGWKYGPVKNPDTKEHPCCVPYEQLPVAQRAKDFIFTAVVNELKAEQTPTNRQIAPYCDNRECGHWDCGVCAIEINDCLARK